MVKSGAPVAAAALLGGPARQRVADIGGDISRA